MNTYKRKALFTAVLAGLGAAASGVARVVCEPLHNFYMNPRNGLVKWDGASEIKDLEATVLKKFGEIQENTKKSQDTLLKAVEEAKKYGETIEAKTADELKKQGETSAKALDEFKTELKKLTDRFTEVEQKSTQRREADVAEMKTAGELFAESDAYKQMMKVQGKNPKSCDPVEVSRKSIAMGHAKATIMNPFPLSNDNPLVAATRMPGVIQPPNRRLMIRDLLPQLPVEGNVLEYVQELLFTSAAAPQGGGASPDGNGEAQPKAEASLTFQLANAIVTTIAHWIPATRQIMSDAPFLAAYIDARLTYGLKLEEEDEVLNSTGAAGELNGLMNQATAFTYGSTNQTALDTLLLAFLQVTLSNYEATGVVLHPLDWANIVKLKDTTGRYLFADPQGVAQPRVWGKNVVPTASQQLGQFLTGAFDLGAAILDREGVSIRVSDQHSDFFIRNMIAVLCEERVGLAVFRSAAFVKGAVSNAG